MSESAYPTKQPPISVTTFGLLSRTTENLAIGPIDKPSECVVRSSVDRAVLELVNTPLRPPPRRESDRARSAWMIVSRLLSRAIRLARYREERARNVRGTCERRTTDGLSE